MGDGPCGEKDGDVGSEGWGESQVAREQPRR